MQELCVFCGNGISSNSSKQKNFQDQQALGFSHDKKVDSQYIKVDNDYSDQQEIKWKMALDILEENLKSCLDDDEELFVCNFCHLNCFSMQKKSKFADAPVHVAEQLCKLVQEFHTILILDPRRRSYDRYWRNSKIFAGTQNSQNLLKDFKELIEKIKKFVAWYATLNVLNEAENQKPIIVNRRGIISSIARWLFHYDIKKAQKFFSIEVEPLLHSTSNLTAVVNKLVVKFKKLRYGWDVPMDVEDIQFFQTFDSSNRIIDLCKDLAIKQAHRSSVALTVRPAAPKALI